MGPLRKLIEVALPLEAINTAAARENFIYKRNPSSIHKWWAQRPLAACRAVIFASLVDDPSSHPEEFPTEAAQEQERQRLFRIIEKLVKWESSNDESLLAAAHAEILKSTGGTPPAVLDPFCGGGSIPLEAQRLGLEAHGSDLNPVAVLITKALVEIPPKFAGRPAVHPGQQGRLIERTWKGADGLADDVRYYGEWMHAEAGKRIGRHYPGVELPREHGGGGAPVIAWLWARTVICPNPACGASMPLARSFALSTRRGKETWAQPVPDRSAKVVRFEIRRGDGKPPDGTVGRRGARCVVCEGDVPLDHLRTEGAAGRMGAQMLAIVAESAAGRIYLPANEQHQRVSVVPVPADVPDTALPRQALGFRVQAYGMTKHRDVFTSRQLATLAMLSDLVKEARERLLCDASASGMAEGTSLAEGGNGARAYADAAALLLAMAVDKMAEYNCSLVPWYSKEDRPKGVFARQALPIVWDFAEVNPLGDMGGTFQASVRIVAEAIESCPANANAKADISQLDSTTARRAPHSVVVCTDPPYYDNVPYADLSDFFYVWLRRAVGDLFPDVCSTLLVPKSEELVATPYRFDGDKEQAERFFEHGLAKAFGHMREAQNPNFPLTVFYAFKQAESTDSGDDADDASQASTGWETMLEGLIGARFSIVGTWPMRTERAGRMRDVGSNALASSVVLVARSSLDTAPLATRKELLAALKRELPLALKRLQHGNIAPVDLAQAAIGPGMGVFSRYSKVVEADGSRMTVRTALGIINQVLAEVLSEQESEFDSDTRWALSWFEQHGIGEGPYGDAELLSKAKDTAVSGLEEAGILKAKTGKVRLLRRDELDASWDPAADRRLTVWEVAQHLIRRLENGGEASAAELLARVGSYGDVARDLAYLLYTICERKSWASEAGPYNALVLAWPELVRIAARQTDAAPAQKGLF